MTWNISAWLLAAVALAYGISVARDAYDEFERAESTTVNAEHGVTIEGLCPSEVGPVQVNAIDSPQGDSNEGADWNLRGAAHPGMISLRWDRPALSGLTGYVVSRHTLYTNSTIFPRWDVSPDSIRTFNVKPIDESVNFEDSSDIEPETTYRYRVFPVAAGDLGPPTRALEIWSLPLDAPAAPAWATADVVVEDWHLFSERPPAWRIRDPVDDHWNVFAYWPLGEPISGMRILRRESEGIAWEVVHEEMNAPDRLFGVWDSYKSWADRDGEPDVEHEYAVCFGNPAGWSMATLATTNAFPDQLVPGLGPPANVNAVRGGSFATLYWDPLPYASVTGYEVERLKRSEDDVGNLREYAPRGQNFINPYVYRDPPGQYRVRALTAFGFGQWSEWSAMEFIPWSDSDAEPGKPEIVSSSSSHDQVNLIWRTDKEYYYDFRIMRREIGRESEFKSLQQGNWVDEADFEWHHAWWYLDNTFTDSFDVRPGTTYEYAMQLGDDRRQGEISESVVVQTLPLPDQLDRPPLGVLNLKAMPTSEGIRLTWDLQDDPARTGIYVRLIIGSDLVQSDQLREQPEWLVQDGRTRGMANVAWHPNTSGASVAGSPTLSYRGDPLLLRPDATDYLAPARRYPHGYGDYCFDVETFGAHGRGPKFFQRECLEPSEMPHCNAVAEEIYQDDGVTVRFRACEESVTTVIRHEVTEDGIDTRKYDQPCMWTTIEEDPYSWWHRLDPIIMRCEYQDDVTPGTMYIYELRQTFADGRTSVTIGEVVTEERAE